MMIKQKLEMSYYDSYSRTSSDESTIGNVSGSDGFCHRNIKTNLFCYRNKIKKNVLDNFHGNNNGSGSK